MARSATGGLGLLVSFLLFATMFSPQSSAASTSLLRFPWTENTSAYITQGYGSEAGTFSHYNGDYYALDLDIQGYPSSGVVRTAATGIVKDVVTGQACSGVGYGNLVDIQSSTTQGTRWSRYAHLASIDSSVVFNGTKYRGSKLGVEGATGNTHNCGVHLHYRWTTTQHCASQSCAVKPEPMSDQTSLVSGTWKTSDNRYVGAETVGVFRWSPLEWRLTDRHSNPVTDHHLTNYGQYGDKAVYGDWNGDGIGTIGVFRNYNPPNARWYLNDHLNDTTSEYQFNFGLFSDKPVAGNWQGSGSRPGYYRAEGSNGRWYINYQFDSTPNFNFVYGLASDLPVTGDWNCDGIETVGIFRSGEWRLNDGFDGSTEHVNWNYGVGGDIAVAGDCDGDGCDSIGVFRPSNNTWYLNNHLDDGNSEYSLSYGVSSDLPVVGDWNNDP